ncbi:MAG: alpha/beta fold hydrolase [Mycobacteriaceae bacterium]
MSEPVALLPLLRARSWQGFDIDDVGRVLAGWDDSGTVQLVEIAPDGTPTVLTDLPGSCSGRYLPGERTVVVSHDHDGNERAQLSLLDPDVPGVLTPLVQDPEHIHALAQVLPGRVLYRTNRRNGVDFDVVARNVATGAEEVLYSRGGMVTEVAQSPDARYLLLGVVGAAAMSTQLLLVDTLASTPDGTVTELTAADAVGRHENLHWLPDSSGFLVTTDRDSDRTVVARHDLDQGAWTVLVADEHDLTGWLSPDGATLLCEANVDGWSELSLRGLDGGLDGGGAPVVLPTPAVIGGMRPAPRFAPGSATVLASASAPDRPGDVLVLDVASGRARHVVGDGVDGAVNPSSHLVPTGDGELVPCYSYAAGEPNGSAVVLVHGGPEGQSRPAFNPVVQGLVAAGHTVCVPNVRGSVGYGRRWYSMDDVRLRMDSVADLAAVHAWLPSLGVDPSRVALWGGSYGGYMVLMGCAFQPELWAAGVDIVGMSSLVTFLENTSPYRRAAREREYGSLAHDRDFLTSASALSRIGDLRAPLVVIHGANDPRVPLSEAEQLHAALTSRGIECELLVYPDEGHGLAKRVNREDAYPRALEFLRRHLSAPVS